jgi:predicted nucleic acid-binding protein
MSCLVLDASVVIKWLFAEREPGNDAHKAIDLFEHIASRQVQVIQPTHWLVEVAAVIAMKSPATAEEDIFELTKLSLDELGTSEAFVLATRLSIELKHHLFDTLYHAVALILPEATLVTADLRYFHKARQTGSIMLLRDLPLA